MNRVQKKGVCIRHGAKHRQCKVEGCTNIVVNGGVCRRHGAKAKMCGVEGCKSQAARRGVCKKHWKLMKNDNVENENGDDNDDGGEACEVVPPVKANDQVTV